MNHRIVAPSFGTINCGFNLTMKRFSTSSQAKPSGHRHTHITHVQVFNITSRPENVQAAEGLEMKYMIMNTMLESVN